MIFAQNSQKAIQMNTKTDIDNIMGMVINTITHTIFPKTIFNTNNFIKKEIFIQIIGNILEIIMEDQKTMTIGGNKNLNLFG